MPSNWTYSGVDNLEVMKNARRYNAYLVALVNRFAPRQGTLLDFGAGAGTFARALGAASRTVACVEPDPALRERLVGDGHAAFADIADIADGRYDFVYSLNVLEHIEDDGAAVRELLRVLKPGGRCLIYVPALQILYSSMDSKVGHFRRYTKAGLKDLLQGAGFSVQWAGYADSLGFFATLAFKMLGNADGAINPGGLVLYDRLIFPLSRALDAIAHPFFGKNVAAVAVKR
ncbi:class I SAM-dependent methyltransferase [Varunaivibrio sulfuroxidans]|uniref:Methyltransferase family protein n=1 Tax=Varunaivibrio sulfuroxidans TaxID=1773489 RepID=A0A4R3JCV3_9PROT|nr:class I SAM-dependent methyltransferase [Varunaivibrio sulfuroxidans]TCS62973.1 methyltransferase family protein [Varunaivibrio sulfuroxidans]WES31949.1 class I SAM-dependent methyltransferase [Varunaivibrio sulfuroxidans]